MEQILELLQLIVLLFIAKHLFVYERYRLSINLRPFRVWVLYWNYKDSCFYRHKRLI